MGYLIGVVIVAFLVVAAAVVIATRRRYVSRPPRTFAGSAGLRRQNSPARQPTKPPGAAQQGAGGVTVEEERAGQGGLSLLGALREARPRLARLELERRKRPAHVPATEAAPAKVGSVPARTRRRLAVAVDASGDVQSAHDAYFVQNGMVAMARGATGGSTDQYAATLVLSAIISSRPQDSTKPEQGLRECVATANRTLRTVPQRDPALSGMVATLDIIYLDPDAPEPVLYFAHVGNGTIWLQKFGSTAIVTLTEPHTFANGPLLRGVGLVSDLVPDTGMTSISPGDRIFMSTRSSDFGLTTEAMNEIAYAHYDDSLQDCAAVLVSLAARAQAGEGITVAAAEITNSGVLTV